MTINDKKKMYYFFHHRKLATVLVYFQKINLKIKILNKYELLHLSTKLN